MRRAGNGTRAPRANRSGHPPPTSEANPERHRLPRRREIRTGHHHPPAPVAQRPLTHQHHRRIHTPRSDAHRTPGTTASPRCTRRTSDTAADRAKQADKTSPPRRLLPPVTQLAVQTLTRLRRRTHRGAPGTMAAHILPRRYRNVRRTATLPRR